MYKPKPMTDADIDKFIAGLESQYASAQDEYAHAVVARDRAQAEYERMYKVPVSPYRLHLLEAIVGLCMLVGSMFFLLWWLYPVYQKIVGGIR